MQIKRLESEFASYKSRAHALLQRKDAELAAAKDNEQVKALEEALKVYMLFGAYFCLLCDCGAYIFTHIYHLILLGG